MKLHQQALLSTPLRNHIHGMGPLSVAADNRARAAAGQSSLMALYEILFSQKQVDVAQVLLTDEDFQSSERRANLRATLHALLQLGIVPILNENDVISTRKTPLRDEGGKVLWDNDSLAMLVSHEIGVELMVLLSDVDGLYRFPPSAETPKPPVIHTFFPDDTINITVGEKSRVGRGGMQAKIDAALKSLSHDVKAVVIASGYRNDTLRDIVDGKQVGTIFVSNPVREDANAESGSPDRVFYQQLATDAREASRALQSALNASERAALINAIADALLENKDEILSANKKDVEQAKLTGVQAPLQSRLVLSESKLKTLAAGIRQIAEGADPIGRVLARTEISPELILQQETVPIGVLLVIFESRPDVLPQVVALALRSGNALLLKGGKEATLSNHTLHSVITSTIQRVTKGRVPREIVSLVETRQAIDDLLKLDSSYIDLVIPRGSAELVKHIQNSTRVPVLGHSEGVCHIFVDRAANMDKAVPIVVDAKTDYPAACNSVETILLHSDIPRDSVEKLVLALQAAKVKIFGGPRAAQVLALPRAESFRHEYSDLGVTVEFVDSVGDAVRHINTYGSSHTDAILTEDEAIAQRFLTEVDSACVFHNCSTRFADGYRFGLGAEVGISTSRIHARGPVGIDGLTTTKWRLVGSGNSAQIVGDYSSGAKKYTHRTLPLFQSSKL